MRRYDMTRAGLRWLLVLTLASAGALAAKEEPPQVTHDGLHLVPGTKVALAYVKPETDFSVYHKVMILDAYVAFRKGWERDRRSDRLNRVSPRDIEKIKSATAELFREVFVETLDAEGGYPVVDAADTDVLLLRPALIDLDVVAPDVNTPGRSYSFASSAGAATLYLEVFDSVSGEILARAVDRKAANYPGELMQWSNKVRNRAAAEKTLGGWAELLRDWFDEVHGKAKD